MLEILPVAVELAAKAHKQGVTSFTIVYQYYPAFEDYPASIWVDVDSSERG